jgi:hypothetical protein
MKRIICHWTAGTYTVSATDRKHYHYIIDGDGGLALGGLAPEDNLNTSDGTYAAHTRGANTAAIGIAIAAMHNARERPFNAGAYPIKDKQVEALVKQCARLAARYGIPVRRDTILTHAEVERTLGIKQSGKWDVVWLPGMEKPGDPIAVGDVLRGKITAAMAPAPMAPPAIEIPAQPTLWQWLVAFFTGKGA